MKTNISPKFKQMALVSILTIILFVVVYFILIVLALWFVFKCVWWSWLLVSERISFGSIAIALALIALGVLVFYFLIKFIFNTHKVDRSHFIEIDEHQEPELFRVIHEVVDAVGTQFPKRIYLSPEVNASVFYDSSFWSMFLPIKKNLHIGMGLIQSTTQQEFKAILAHEFGHFSQRSMKVGSYVYNVNQVIYNMLYDNDGFDDFISQMSSINIFFSITAILAFTIFRGIKWILNKLYLLINISYMGLSRQMEFHADAIACQVAGSDAVKSSLLRLDLASYALNDAINFYYQKENAPFKSNNLFRDQKIIMHALALKNKISIQHDLPQVTLEDVYKNQQTKLNFEDQWASHPTTEQRIAAVDGLQSYTGQVNHRPTTQLMTQYLDMCETFTKQIFTEEAIKGKSILSDEDLRDHYQKFRLELEYHPLYNEYYNYHDLNINDDHNEKTTYDHYKIEDLFSTSIVEKAKSAFILTNDINQLKQLTEKDAKIKSFDYDGIRYSKKDAASLIEILNKTLVVLENELKNNDAKVASYFDQLSLAKNHIKESATHKDRLTKCLTLVEKIKDQYNTLVGDAEFISKHLSFNVIRSKMTILKSSEKTLKSSLTEIVNDPVMVNELNDEMKAILNDYINVDLVYFSEEAYIQSNLEKLTFIIQYIPNLVDYYQFKAKKDYLDYQTTLMP